MEIYTSYFAKLKKIPEDIIPVSIARWSPFWYKGKKYIKLAPEEYILNKYKTKEFSEEEYKKEFLKQLFELDRDKIIKELSKFGDKVCLLCYEKSNDFCHRHLVCEWLIGKPNELNI